MKRSWLQVQMVYYLKTGYFLKELPALPHDLADAGVDEVLAPASRINLV